MACFGCGCRGVQAVGEAGSGGSREIRPGPDHASPCVIKISISSRSSCGIIDKQTLEKGNDLTRLKEDVKDDFFISTLTPVVVHV